MQVFRLLSVVAFSMLIISTATAQPDRWQQRVRCVMEIDFNVDNHRFTGRQQLTYYNNSPDTLNRVFYHLYFNAFQPGSAMGVRSRNIMDPDPRVANRIDSLKPNEIGYHKVNSLTQDGKATQYQVVGTVLEVTLPDPILPGDSTLLVMDFDSQVPLQIRRSGRYNSEGIAYSMAQWYPKIAEYDYQGWHAHPYIGREFYGVWGDFDVKISINPKFIVAAGGYLQNPQEIGHGYTAKEVQHRGKKITYHFLAPDVHDFVWAADPEYRHLTRERRNGNMMHFFFQPNERTTENWEQLPLIMDTVFAFVNRTYGQYPYKTYAFIQAGDGGMEYPMATLITGERSLVSLVGVSVHELMHSWYQMVLATNESLYAWMDEGFTSYASNEVMNYLRKLKMIPGNPDPDPQLDDVQSYISFSQSGLEEPLIIHADHFNTNSAYGVGAYVKGSVFLHQLHYIMGEEAFDEAMLRYFNTWKFKHPNSNDFIRVMEKVSDMELDWFREYFVNTTHTIDYDIAAVEGQGNQTVVTLERVGRMPMPIDIRVTYTDGRTQNFTIPLEIMRNEKRREGNVEYTVLPDWSWTNPDYRFTLPVAESQISAIEIDPTRRMADIDRDGNLYRQQ